MLERMTVERCDGDGTLPLVMLLVNVLIEKLIVNETMRVIKSNLIDENANGQINQNARKPGHIAKVLGKAFQAFQIIADERQRHTNDNLIEYNHSYGVYQLSLINGLVCIHLDFVATEKLGLESQIHQHK